MPPARCCPASRGSPRTWSGPRHPNLPLLTGAGTLLYLLSAGISYAAIGAQASQEAESREAEARNLARDAQLYALRMQINPHFLFNSLNSIAALATADGERARRMCIRLSDFLRTSLALGDRENIPLPEELALARRYLDVEQVRFGERLRVSEEIGPGARSAACPPCCSSRWWKTRSSMESPE